MMNKPARYGDTIVSTTKAPLEQDIKEFTYYLPTNQLRVSYYSTGMAAYATLEEIQTFLELVKEVLIDEATR